MIFVHTNTRLFCEYYHRIGLLNIYTKLVYFVQNTCNKRDLETSVSAERDMRPVYCTDRV